jgi:hypothetical protein
MLSLAMVDVTDAAPVPYASVARSGVHLSLLTHRRCLLSNLSDDRIQINSAVWSTG